MRLQLRAEVEEIHRMRIPDDVDIIGTIAESSTCRKRAVVCVLTSSSGMFLSAGFNQCIPPDGGCPRIGIASTLENYKQPLECVSSHAETQAIAALPGPYMEQLAYTAHLYGHDFFCEPCKLALETAGVQEFVIHSSEDFPGTGVRKVPYADTRS